MNLPSKIQQIDRLKEELDRLGLLREEAKERLAQKIRMEWNFHSNVIEGNQLTYGETRSLLISGLTANGKSLKDHLDMKGHNEALKKLEGMADKEVKITESLIKEFHDMILVDPFKEHPDVLKGQYKEKENYLYNNAGERIDFTPFEEVPKKLNELINWTNNAIFLPKRKKEKYSTHPLLIAAIFHMRFIMIHPFDDGNGRICRIFMNIILMQCGYPPIIIKSEEREAYFQHIELAREQGEEHLADFLADGLIRSLELYLSAGRGEPIDEPDDLLKRIKMLDIRIKGLNKDEIKVERSETSIREVINKSWIPLTKKILSVSKEIEPWFYTSLITRFVNGRRAEEFNIKDETIYDLTLSIHFNGFKKAGLQTFSISKDITIRFTQYTYLIEAEKVELHNALYNQPLTNEEIERLANSALNSLLLDIEHILKGLEDSQNK